MTRPSPDYLARPRNLSIKSGFERCPVTSTIGLKVFNVTNHFVDLHQVLANLAADAGLRAFERDDLHTGRANGRAPSRWVVMAQADPGLGSGWRRLQADSSRLWTDQYSNVLSVLRL